LKKLILLGALFCLVLPSQHATATTINFDVAADGITPVASGTNINTLYSSLGVTFGCFNGTGINTCTGNPQDVSGAGNAFAVSDPFLSASAPNVISVTSGFVGEFANTNNFYFSATFSSSVSSVSIDALPIPPAEFLFPPTNSPFIWAFDSSGNFLTSAFYTFTNVCVSGVTTCPYETLTVTNPNIAFVAFSSDIGQGGGNQGVFDNLTFSSGAVGVPEPSSLLLLSSGLVALAWMRRVRKT
jgi:hypothetical protein